MDDGAFQWDDAKATANRSKHGVSFEMAREAFDDPFLLDWLGDDDAVGERRYAALAMAQQRLLFIAYTLRGDAIRIISARQAVPLRAAAVFRWQPDMIGAKLTP